MSRRLLLIVVLTLSALADLRPPPAVAIEDSSRLWLVGTSAFRDKLYPVAQRALQEFVNGYPRDPRAAEGWLLLGEARLAAEKPDLEGALKAFRQALTYEKPPGRSQEAKFWEAETLFRMKRFPEALAAYDTVVRTDAASPLAPDALYGRAWCELELKQPRAAVGSFTQLLEVPAWASSPLIPQATYALAHTLVELQQYAEAEALLAGFVTKYPADKQVADARYLLGWTRLQTGKTAEGIRDLRAFVKAYPRHELAETARREITDAVQQLGDRTELATEYQTLMAEESPPPERLYAAGVIAGKLGEPREQEAAWKRLRQAFPGHPLAERAALALAQAASTRADYQEALTLATEAARSAELQADAYLMIGQAQLKLKNYPAALDAFRTVTATPDVAPGLRFQALAGSAMAAEEQQRWADALKLYAEVASGSPDAALRQWAGQAVLALGKARLAQGDLPVALDAFQAAERLSPPPGRSQEARYWTAETLFRQKKHAEARAAYEAVVRGDAASPLAPEAVYGLAWLELEQKRLDQAVRGFRQFLEKWPGHPLASDATLELGRALVDAKRYGDAVPVLSGFLSKYPSHDHAADAQYLLGWAELGAGKTADGIKDLRTFVSSYPTSELVPAARRNIVEAVERLGDKGELSAVYQDLMNDQAATADDLYDAGVIAAQLGQVADQGAALRRLRQAFPHHPLAQRAAFDLAHIAYQQGRYEEAASLAGEAARSDELRTEAELIVGEAQLKLRSYDAALDAFKTVSATPGLERGLRYRALAGSAVGHEEQGQWADALRLYGEVASGSPDAALRQWGGEAVLALGKARLAQGDLAVALEAFRAARKLSPPPGKPPEARYWEAETLFRQKKYPEARAAYEAVLRADPVSPVAADAVYGLAWLELDQKRLEQAVRGFRQFLEKWPDHPQAADATFALARTLVDLKRYADAVPLLKTFTAKYPSHEHAPDAQYLLGWTELATGKAADGITDLRAFASAYPSHELVAAARRKITEAVGRLGDAGELATQYQLLMKDPAATADDLYDAGVLAGRLGHVPDQEAAWNRLRHDFPDSPLAQRAALDQAQLAYKEAHYDQVVKLATEAAAREELGPEASLLTGEAELKLKDYPAALDAFKAALAAQALESALRFRALAGSAVAHEQQRQLGEALPLYEQVAADSPDDALRQWARERAATVRTEQKRETARAALDEAEALLKKQKYAEAAARARPVTQSDETDLRVEALLLVGDAELKQKHDQPAQQAYETAAATTGIDPALRLRALAGTGVAYEEQGQWAEALARYEEIAAGPDEALKQWATARVTEVKTKQTRQIQTALERAATAYERKQYGEAIAQARAVVDGASGPLRAEGWLVVGRAQLKLKQYAAALEAFDEAAAAPGIEPVLLYRAREGSAMTYQDQQQWADALQRWEEIAASSPDAAQRRRAREMISAVKARLAPPKPLEKKAATKS